MRAWIGRRCRAACANSCCLPPLRHTPPYSAHLTLDVLPLHPPPPMDQAGDASGTTYFNVFTKQWDEAAMALIDDGLKDWVPELVGPNEVGCECACSGCMH